MTHSALISVRHLIVLLFLALLLLGVSALTQGTAVADDDPAINAQGSGVNRVLTVLRHRPEAASQSCLDAVGAMHKAQKQLEDVENREDDPDIGLVRDVLASDMEDVITMCGADAHTLCREKAGQDAELAKLCPILPHDPSDDPS